LRQLAIKALPAYGAIFPAFETTFAEGEIDVEPVTVPRPSKL
jgi:hypothetical protein